MTMTKKHETRFVDVSDRIDRMLADPEIAAEVAKVEARAETEDRLYAMNLAMVRKAAEMTQTEIAEKLGVHQGDISKLEHRSDLLLSTLVGYLIATGAEHPRLVVDIHGRSVELNLDNFNTAKR
jgi:hypothetical protein